jgi:predicted nucleic acid-binding protein
VKQVLIDTSVWVEHFRENNPALSELLALDVALTHPMVIGELSCGTPPDRSRTLSDLAALGHTQQASLAEVMEFIEREQLFGLGCGLIDLLLLASTLMTPGTELWTLDKRLSALASRFAVLHHPVRH